MGYILKRYLLLATYLLLGVSLYFKLGRKAIISARKIQKVVKDVNFSDVTVQNWYKRFKERALTFEIKPEVGGLQLKI